MGSTHWLVNAAREAGLSGADAAEVPHRTPAGQAWAAVLKQTGADEEALVQAAARHFHIPVAELDEADPSARNLLPRETAEKHTLFPLAFEYSTLVVATADPTDYDAEQEIVFTSGRYAKFRMAAPWAITRALQRGYGGDDLPAGAARPPRGRERAGALTWGTAPAAGARAADGDDTAAAAGASQDVEAEAEKPLIMPQTRTIDDGAPAADTDPTPAAETAPAPAAEPEPVAGLPRVLVVDDDPESRLMVRAVLGEDRFTVSEASGGADALNMLKRGDRFALAIVDLMMPVMDGRQLLSAIRNAPPPEVRRMPVVVLTASRSADAEPELLRDGADDYIRKPIDPPVFNARIAAVLRRAGG